MRKRAAVIRYNPATSGLDISRMVTIPMAAEILGCSRYAIDYAVANGDLRVYRPIGVTYLHRGEPAYHIRHTDLARWWFGSTKGDSNGNVHQ